MESVMLTLKFGLFCAMEIVVVGAMGIALILGLVQIVKHTISESRHLDAIAPDTGPASV
jgi:hypothetical protein